MLKVPFLDLRLHHEPLLTEVREAFDEVIDSCAFAGGRFVEQFEGEFAAFCEAKHALGVANGTDALWAALFAVGVKSGDEVITVASTFMATVEAITHCGAKPVFVDIDERTYTMNPALLEAAITPRTRAIVPVHLFGQPADMDPILAIARRHGLAVVEDACQAHGARYKNRPVGTLGDAGCFSFYPGKNLGAFGEAGGVVTNRDDVADFIRLFRDHGQRKKYDHVLDGWNARMDGLQGAVLSIKLKHLARGNELRRRHAAVYDELLRELPVVRPVVAPGVEPVFHIYAIRVAGRDLVLNAMAEAGVSCGIHYPVPVHRMKAYEHLGVPAGSLPVSETCAEGFLSLPMFPELTQPQLVRVAEALAGTLALSEECAG
ncbi:MAG TPA: erythromycin biosynthesis sensory transduction protein eryC1 [Verrucomicrobiales bacterium]|nr:erythromycin biosynthesis sensory transduction protein eryC1 [Verrucomicrobiales bacterium]